MNINALWKRTMTGLTVLLIALTALYVVSDAEKKTLDNATRAGLPGRFVPLLEGVTHYDLVGPADAPLVVLVHGFSVPYYIWDTTVEALTAAGFRVLRYDLYGRGYSDRPDVDYTLGLFTGQLHELLSALDLQGPVDLVGLSFGGPVTASYANRYPDQVRSLTLVDPQVAPVSSGDIFPLNVPLVGEYIMGVYMAPHMLPNSQADDFYRPERYPDWETRYRDQLQYRGFKRAILSSIREMPRLDALGAYERLGQAGIPVMLVWGRQDQTVSATDIDRLRSAVPQAIFEPVDQAGHLPHYEQAGVVNPILVKFLSRTAK